LCPPLKFRQANIHSLLSGAQVFFLSPLWPLGNESTHRPLSPSSGLGSFFLFGGGAPPRCDFLFGSFSRPTTGTRSPFFDDGLMQGSDAYANHFLSPTHLPCFLTSPLKRKKFLAKCTPPHSTHCFLRHPRYRVFLCPISCNRRLEVWGLLFFFSQPKRFIPLTFAPALALPPHPIVPPPAVLRFPQTGSPLLPLLFLRPAHPSISDFLVLV